jgi:hypothetical protein
VSTEGLLQANREDGLEANTEKNKYMVIFPLQSAGQNRNLLSPSNLFKNVPKFKHLRKTER